MNLVGCFKGKKPGPSFLALNLAVKRNLKRFPADFMFQLTREEFDGLRFQIETLEKGNSLRFGKPAG